MDITIGNKTLSVEGQIYISPEGSDENNGLSSSSPVLSLSKAISLCSNNYAIFFMEGNHSFAVNYNKYIDINGYNLTFYSNPNNTTITISHGYSPSAVSSAMFGNGTYNAYNLNLRIVFRKYDTISDGSIINVHNCLIDLRESLELIITSGVSSDSIVENSILYANSGSYGGTIGSQNVSTKNNCLVSEQFTVDSSCISFNADQPNYEVRDGDILVANTLIFKAAMSANDGTKGVYIGDYSEWATLPFMPLKKISIEKISSSNLPSKFGSTDEIHIFLTSDKKMYVTDMSGIPQLIKSHEHSNYDILSKFSLSNNGELLYDGSSLNIQEGTQFTIKIYDNSSTYNVDEYVSYNNKLYRCITDITTPEEFNISNWQLVIGDETQYYVFKEVTELPTSDISENTIYLVQNENSTSDTPEYIQYKHINGSWCILGGSNTSTNIGTTVSIGLTEW